MICAYVCVVLSIGACVSGFPIDKISPDLEKSTAAFDGAPPSQPEHPTSHVSSNGTESRILATPDLVRPPGRLNGLIFDSFGPPAITTWQHSYMTNGAGTESSTDIFHPDEADLENIFSQTESTKESVTVKYMPNEMNNSALDKNALKLIWPDETEESEGKTNKSGAAIDEKALREIWPDDPEESEEKTMKHETANKEKKILDEEIEKYFGPNAAQFTNTTGNDLGNKNTDEDQPVYYQESDGIRSNFTANNETSPIIVIELENGTIVYDIDERWWTPNQIRKIYHKHVSGGHKAHMGPTQHQRNLLSTGDLTAQSEQNNTLKEDNLTPQQEQHDPSSEEDVKPFIEQDKSHSGHILPKHNASNKHVVCSYLVLMAVGLSIFSL